MVHSLTSVSIKEYDKYTEALVAIFSPQCAQPPNWWCPEGKLLVTL